MCKLKKMSADAGACLGSTLLWAISIFMGLSASMLAWIMPLTGMAPSTYLTGCGAISLVLAVWIQRGDH